MRIVGNCLDCWKWSDYPKLHLWCGCYPVIQILFFIKLLKSSFDKGFWFCFYHLLQSPKFLLVGIYFLKVNNGNTRVIFEISLLFTLNRSHKLFCCFRCWHWASKYELFKVRCMILCSFDVALDAFSNTCSEDTLINPC